VVAGDECHLGEDEVDGRYDGRRDGGDSSRERLELLAIAVAAKPLLVIRTRVTAED
jgi:hypothetical protein